MVGGFCGWKAPRTEVLLVSSAAVERNARIGNDAEARKADIPIVQLNPGGVLNQKYAGETALRSSGAAYTILRPVGISSAPPPPLLPPAQASDSLHALQIPCPLSLSAEQSSENSRCGRSFSPAGILRFNRCIHCWLKATADRCGSSKRSGAENCMLVRSMRSLGFHASGADMPNDGAQL